MKSPFNVPLTRKLQTEVRRIKRGFKMCLFPKKKREVKPVPNIVHVEAPKMMLLISQLVITSCRQNFEGNESPDHGHNLCKMWMITSKDSSRMNLDFIYRTLDLI